jgi:hypothetical protein
MAAAKSCAGRKGTDKIGFHSFLCRQLRLHHQGFNAESPKRFRRTPPHPATQDRITILKSFSHARMIMPLGVAMRAGTVALAMLRRTRTIRAKLFPRYPPVLGFKYYERRASPKMGRNGYPVVRWHCNSLHVPFPF